jgi:hypothetical protein
VVSFGGKCSAVSIRTMTPPKGVDCFYDKLDPREIACNGSIASHDEVAPAPNQKECSA